MLTSDAENHLTSTAGQTYLYDGDRKRVEKTSGSPLTANKLYWYGSGGDILAETNASGTTTAEYVFFGGKRIAMLPAGGNPIYYVEDLLGTSRVTTTNTGSVCYDADFYPYGGERSYINTCPQSYKFEGKERDTETGNDDFGARYYSNRFARWLSSDWSSVPVPVPYANLANPQTLNLHAMVADDPESFADLDGHVENASQGTSGESGGQGPSCAASGQGASSSPATNGCQQRTTDKQDGAKDNSQVGLISRSETTTVTNKDGSSTTTTVQTTAQFSLSEKDKNGEPVVTYSRTTTTTTTKADGTSTTSVSAKVISAREANFTLGRYFVDEAHKSARWFSGESGFDHAFDRDVREHPGYYGSVILGAAAIPAAAVSVVGGVVLGVGSGVTAIYDKVTGP